MQAVGSMLVLWRPPNREYVGLYLNASKPKIFDNARATNTPAGVEL